MNEGQSNVTQVGDEAVIGYRQTKHMNKEIWQSHQASRPSVHSALGLKPPARQRSGSNHSQPHIPHCGFPHRPTFADTCAPLPTVGRLGHEHSDKELPAQGKGEEYHTESPWLCGCGVCLRGEAGTTVGWGLRGVCACDDALRRRRGVDEGPRGALVWSRGAPIRLRRRNCVN